MALDTEWIKIGLEIGVVAGGCIGAFFAVKNQNEILAVKLDAKMDAHALMVASQAETIKRIEIQVAKIADVMSDQRLLDQRLAAAEQDIRDLQRGEGRVLPIARGAYEHGGKS